MTKTMPVKGAAPSTEVSAKATRRRLAGPKRLEFFAKPCCTETGALGALFRREGIYSSQVSRWRIRAKRAAVAALAPKKRGPEAPPPCGGVLDADLSPAC